MKRLLLLAVLPGLLLPAGCSFGPKALTNTHHQYTEAVKRISEEHLLFTLLRMRYNETPTNLDLSSIAAQYEISTSAEARPFFSTESVSPGIFRDFTKILPYASLGASNRPTFSYVPGDDGSAVRRFLTPITPETLVFLGQSGWPVADVMRLYLDRINGVPNGVLSSGPSRGATPDYERFLRVSELLQKMSEQEIMTVAGEDRVVPLGDPVPSDRVTAASITEAAKNGFEYRKGDDGQWTLIRHDTKMVMAVTPGSEKSPELAEFRKLLNLRKDQSTYEVTVSTRGEPDPIKHAIAPLGELRAATRSNAQVLYFLSNGIEVPAGHLSSGVAVGSPGDSELTRGLFRVKCATGHHAPAGAFVAVWFRDHWFYIDDADHETKRTFSLMMQLSRLDFARNPLNGPALTLPVGGR